MNNDILLNNKDIRFLFVTLYVEGGVFGVHGYTKKVVCIDGNNQKKKKVDRMLMREISREDFIRWFFF